MRSSKHGRNPTGNLPNPPQRQERAAGHTDKTTAGETDECSVIDPSVPGKPTEEQEHRAREWRFWERQIRVAKWLNGITIVSAIAA